MIGSWIEALEEHIAQAIPLGLDIQTAWEDILDMAKENLEMMKQEKENG